ncbi:hypothetical protein ACFU78_00820 [Streptomyces tendae]
MRALDWAADEAALHGRPLRARCRSTSVVPRCGRWRLRRRRLLSRPAGRSRCRGGN